MKAQNTRTGDAIPGTLEGLWGRTQSMDSGIRVTICKTGDRRLLDEVFESKPIKRGGKIPFRQLKKFHTKPTMSFNTANNNTFATAPTSPNPYVSRKINNMDQAQVMKREREDCVTIDASWSQHGHG